ncbi:adenosine kinase [Schizosaccharomyces japonicus yFS275]|uniref:Adenosine kinase n=1 Tax=Schizosaccharomyces japonicus (strain yFS275 / FY16936) TaxID=402676 RepID=B6JXE2_SCHJY|nr:adenosine kinase [Schizosaccharomyces japonicus yFS275]EEB06043.1 adenosine kinase [Schizosaccharomyces japonicus yFS275]
MASSLEYSLFGLENPLLDYYIAGGEEILAKYGLKANDAILAGDEHMGIYTEACSSYSAGGAAQNSMRAAQYVMPPNSTVFTGCVGNDKFAEMLRESNDKAGLRSEFSVDPDTPTGVCAVVLTKNGANRSLITNLGAANHYKLEHLQKPEVWAFVEKSRVIYVGGYHLTVCVDAILALAKHAAEKNKPFVLNLSAPFIPQFFKDQLDSVMPYADVVICNETEAAAFAESHGVESTDLKDIALAIAGYSKVNNARSRAVVITHGAESTNVAQDGKVTVYTPNRVPAEEVVDTNGAGDAFAGGFIAALAKGQGIDYAITLGHWLGQECIKVSGTTLAEPKKQYPLP